MAQRRIFSIIVAGGTGSRFGASLPKQYCDIDGMPVLLRTLDAMTAALPDAEQYVVVSKEMTSLWEELCNQYGAPAHHIVIGGATRFESVANALCALRDRFGNLTADDIISIHDGARPLVTSSLVNRAITALCDNVDGVIPATPVTDSLRRLPSDRKTEGSHGDALGGSVAVDRSAYRAVQTPQFFPATLLLDAYTKATDRIEANPDKRGEIIGRFTDDASVMEFGGYNNIVLTPGSPENIKITHPNDLAVAALLLAERRS